MAKQEQPKRVPVPQNNPAPVQPQSTSSKSKGLSEEEIRTAAYYRWLKRGGHHGKDMHDWIEAEKEIKTRKGGTR